MVGAMDPYWGSLHCVRSLIVPLLTQMYKWVLVTEQGGGGGGEGAGEETSIGAPLTFTLSSKYMVIQSQLNRTKSTL